MLHDAAGPDDAGTVAVLLHPHPHYGGDRHHPFVSRLFDRLPREGMGAIRFDFSSADSETAIDQVTAAIDIAVARWPQASVALAGYSFGAGIATRVADDRCRGWFLVAPPAAMLDGAALGASARPKRVVVARHDQLSSMDDIDAATATWAFTDTAVVDDDHFLWRAMDEVVEDCVAWLRTIAASATP